MDRYYDDLLNPCIKCGKQNPRMWRYKYPLFPTKPPAWDRLGMGPWLHPPNKKEWKDLYCWGVYCETCRSHKATEVGMHKEIEDAIEAWNVWNS